MAPGQRSPTTAGRASSTPSPGRAHAAAPPARKSEAAVRVLAGMSLQQRVGQLLMVGAKATGPAVATSRAINSYHVGNVILTGRSSLGVGATARVTAGLRAQATAEATRGTDLFVATDQEGGQVQVLSGPGFSSIPNALTQGGWSASTLRARAAGWGSQLRSAGVNVNLAPVTDTVPRAAAQSNRPIGFYQREFGFTPELVGPHAAAFVAGMAASGVTATPKHFPGLGRVRGNTDTSAAVTDSITTRTDANLGPFRRAVAVGSPFVMMSSAFYSKLDPSNPACFSEAIVTGILRGDLGFNGVVISDDLGSSKQVARWSAGSRATQFIAAGGDLVLTADPAMAPAMASALVAEANRSAAFRRQVDVSALRVLRAKAAAGLLPAA
ncbi:MAG: beta-N-acetylhexosaminidase [Actinomycetota bacterium]|nr:beta-N-acetylhexosaminidase [Actinomycetota bacterium]